MIAYILVGDILTFIIVASLVCRFRGKFKFLLFTHLKRHLFDRTDDAEPSKIYDGGK